MRTLPFLMCALLAAHPARGGVLDTWGMGEVGDAGNAGVAVPGLSSPWANPAAMRTARLDESAEWLQGTADFQVDGEDVRVSEGPSGLLAGLVVGGYWLGLPPLHAGVSLYLPARGPFNWIEAPEGNDEVDPTAQVPRFANGLDRLDISLAAGMHLFPRLSLGVGVDAAARIETLTFVVLDDLDVPEEARKGQDVTIRPTFHPMVGLLLELGPLERPVSLGLVGRSERYMEDFGVSSVELGGLLGILYRHYYIRHYRPPMATLGASWSPVSGISVRAEGSWEQWSRAQGPYGEDLSGSWGDTQTARVGVVADA
ncbi:MAG: hypothetical protein QGG40_15305, partial [Myxococcota bacterium]|nr:hypothetical protein [Myxococcota bacterium]